MDLLNARGRHRLDRVFTWDEIRPEVEICSTPEGVIVSIAADVRHVPADPELCSTPEGVIVSIARTGRSWSWPPTVAQRPRASSSRSRHLECGRSRQADLLNARGRHRLDRIRATWPRSARPSAQRPRASSSRSHLGRSTSSLLRGLLNARGRHRLDHSSDPIRRAPIVLCSTPEGVIVSIACIASGPRRPTPTAQRPGRHRLDRSESVVSWTVMVACSTPEGVIVSIARKAGESIVIGDICSTPEGVIVSIAPTGGDP